MIMPDMTVKPVTVPAHKKYEWQEYDYTGAPRTVSLRKNCRGYKRRLDDLIDEILDE
jgi:hypothetical protein